MALSAGYTISGPTLPERSTPRVTHASVNARISRASLFGLVLLLAGCGGGYVPADDVGPVDVDLGDVGPDDTDTSPQAVTAADEILADLEGAQAVVNDYWTQHWNEFFTEWYTPPALNETGGYMLGLYDGTEGVATCQGDPLPADNAVYCPGEHTVSFDIGLMDDAVDLGDSFIYLIVAHEYGHAVAGQLGEGLNSVASELQADCLAGAAFYGAVADGTLMLEEGDVKEITNGLTDVADESPWGDPSDHGDPFERIEAFNAGRTNGPGACFPE
jgi:predicted metalloprotease